MPIIPLFYWWWIRCYQSGMSRTLQGKAWPMCFWGRTPFLYSGRQLLSEPSFSIAHDFISNSTQNKLIPFSIESCMPPIIDLEFSSPWWSCHLQENLNWSIQNILVDISNKMLYAFATYVQHHGHQSLQSFLIIVRNWFLPPFASSVKPMLYNSLSSLNLIELLVKKENNEDFFFCKMKLKDASWAAGTFLQFKGLNGSGALIVTIDLLNIKPISVLIM